MTQILLISRSNCVILVWIEQGKHEQNNITVEMEIALSTALEQIWEVEGIVNDDNDDDDDADFVPLEDAEEVWKNSVEWKLSYL